MGDDRTAFRNALMKYRADYVEWGIGIKGETAMIQSQDYIQQKIGRLQNLVNNSNKEIKNFSSDFALRQKNAADLARGSRSLQTQLSTETDAANRAEFWKRSAVANPDFRGLYWRLGGLGALLFVMLFIPRRVRMVRQFV